MNNDVTWHVFIAGYVKKVFKRLRSKFCDGQWGALNILGFVYFFKLLIYDDVLYVLATSSLVFIYKLFKPFFVFSKC